MKKGGIYEQDESLLVEDSRREAKRAYYIKIPEKFCNISSLEEEIKAQLSRISLSLRLKHREWNVEREKIY